MFVTMIQIRTGEGSEGYVPTLSCFLPSPDTDAASTVKRFVLIRLMLCRLVTKKLC